MAYILKLHKKVERQLERIPAQYRERMIEVMRSLRDEPRPAGCLQLEDSLFRLRVGEYRIIYAIFDQELVVFVCKTARRSETTYRNLRAFVDQANREVRGE